MTAVYLSHLCANTYAVQTSESSRDNTSITTIRLIQLYLRAGQKGYLFFLRNLRKRACIFYICRVIKERDAGTQSSTGAIIELIQSRSITVSLIVRKESLASR
jgi:hypothetical protein